MLKLRRGVVVESDGDRGMLVVEVDGERRRAWADESMVGPAEVGDEVVLSFVYVMVIASTTDRRALTAVAPIAAGVALAAVYLIGIPVDAGSINPARSVAAATIEGGRAVYQLWLFLLAPLVGGSIAGAVVPMFSRSPAPEAAEQ